MLKKLQLEIPPAVIDKQETPALVAIRRELAEAIQVLSNGKSILPKAADAIRSGDVQHMEALLTLIRHGAIDPNAGVGENFDTLRMALLEAEDPPSPASATSAGSTPPPRMSVYERIARLIDAGFEIDLRTDEGRTLLHNAAEGNSRPEVLQALLDHGIYVNSLCESKTTALHLAAWEPNRGETVSLLLRHDASTSARDKLDRTPLMIAVTTAKPEIVQEIINKMKARGEDIDATDPSGSTALHYAVGDADREEVVAVLLRHGANPLAENKDGDTPRYLHTKDLGQPWPF